MSEMLAIGHKLMKTHTQKVKTEETVSGVSPLTYHYHQGAVQKKHKKTST